jgi:HSP20 family protein
MCDKAYSIQYEVSGVKSEDISLSLEKGGKTLKLCAIKREHNLKECKVFDNNRSFGELVIEHSLPPDIDIEKLDTQLPDSIFSLLIPISSQKIIKTPIH